MATRPKYFDEIKRSMEFLAKDPRTLFLGQAVEVPGTAHECIKYARNHALPIHWIVEDNEKSVCTDTRKTWNMKKLTYEDVSAPDITYYRYTSKYPHAGAGQRVQF
jgi:hypothetical protein